MIPERTKKSQKILIEFCKYLQNKIGNLKNKRIAEIGSWTGCSAEIFANYFGQVVCIDRWEATEEKSDISNKYDMKEVEKIFDERAKKYKNIVKMRGDSGSELSKYDDHYFDVIYIDADHTYNGVKKDIENSKNKTKLLTGHDYIKGFPGVIKAVNECLGIPEKVFQEGTWIERKKYQK